MQGLFLLSILQTPLAPTECTYNLQNGYYTNLEWINGLLSPKGKAEINVL